MKNQCLYCKLYLKPSKVYQRLPRLSVGNGSILLYAVERWFFTQIFPAIDFFFPRFSALIFNIDGTVCKITKPEKYKIE